VFADSLTEPFHALDAETKQRVDIRLFTKVVPAYPFLSNDLTPKHYH
jgi:hypothetical protein